MTFFWGLLFLAVAVVGIVTIRRRRAAAAERANWLPRLLAALEIDVPRFASGVYVQGMLRNYRQVDIPHLPAHAKELLKRLAFSVRLVGKGLAVRVSWDADILEEQKPPSLRELADGIRDPFTIAEAVEAGRQDQLLRQQLIAAIHAGREKTRRGVEEERRQRKIQENLRGGSEHEEAKDSASLSK